MRRQRRRRGLRCRLWLRRVSALAGKELVQLARDRALFIFIVYIFTLDIYIASGGVPIELSNAALVVQDADRSNASRELIEEFRAPYFRLAGEAADGAAALRLLDRGQAKLVLNIPADFSARLRQPQETVAVQLLVDTAAARSGFLAASYGQRIADRYAAEHAERRLARAGVNPDALPTIENERRFRFNSDLNEAWFNTLSELLTMLTAACVLLPAAATVREKERGTIEQLLVSPLSPAQLLLAKIFANVAVMLVGTAISLFAVMQPLFGMPARGSLVLFFMATALYVFTTAGLGIVLATFARSSGQVGMLVLLTVMPIIMLSGTWTLPESMPWPLLTLIALFPLRHFIDIAYGILLRGAGLALLWDSLLALAAIGAGLFSLGLWRFRRQFGW